MEVWVEVFSDRMEVAADGKSATVRPSVPYVGQRILVGSFQSAMDCTLRQDRCNSLSMEKSF